MTVGPWALGRKPELRVSLTVVGVFRWWLPAFGVLGFALQVITFDSENDDFDPQKWSLPSAINIRDKASIRQTIREAHCLRGLAALLLAVFREERAAEIACAVRTAGRDEVFLQEL